MSEQDFSAAACSDAQNVFLKAQLCVVCYVLVVGRAATGESKYVKISNIARHESVL
jgi:hypothetical protein